MVYGLSTALAISFRQGDILRHPPLDVCEIPCRDGPHHPRRNPDRQHPGRDPHALQHHAASTHNGPSAHVRPTEDNGPDADHGATLDAAAVEVHMVPDVDMIGDEAGV